MTEIYFLTVLKTGSPRSRYMSKLVSLGASLLLLHPILLPLSVFCVVIASSDDSHTGWGHPNDLILTSLPL